jgi:lytic cellulose monooxygenase (C4-dehydrogenating)
MGDASLPRPGVKRFSDVSHGKALLCLIPWSGTAAHGSVVDPASRNYDCRLRWGSDFQNPAMAQQDPMCRQA